nr:helix-turn-helix transcriptional regulator [Streptomyces coryli]
MYGRSAELSALTRLIEDARAATSGVLVVRGEPGIGKSALLDAAAEAPPPMAVLRGTGIESEAQLPFAGLHLLLRPALGKLARLPAPQQRALEGAFGLGPAAPADRMLIGLAVLSLLSELADDGPLLCLVDDAQWLDRPTAEALLFAVRRLGAEPIAVVFAVRDGELPFPTPGLPELRLPRLGPADAAALLDAQRGGALLPEVRHRVLDEARGNPLALIELPVGLAAEGDGTGLPLTSRLQDAFHGQVARLPEATRALLLVAAADESGELATVLAAARALSAGADALSAGTGLSAVTENLSAGLADLSPALDAGLVHLDEAGRQLTFRHPLVRAAVYRGARPDHRLRVHRALADTGPADRRAWHLARAATGPDEHAAAELERAAAQAAERNGHAAAAAAFERAASLTTETAARGRRLALAAEFTLEAGELSRAAALAERAAPDVAPALRHRLVRTRAAAKAGAGSLRDANDLLLAEADRIGSAAGGDGDPSAPLALLIEATGNAWFAGDQDMAAQVTGHLDALELPAADDLLPVHHLLDWILSLVTGRPTDHLPPMADVVTTAGAAPLDYVRSRLHISGLGMIAGIDTWSHDLAHRIAAGSRAEGRIGALPAALYHVAVAESLLGRHRDALGSATEAADLAHDTGQWQWFSLANGVLAYLAAAEGDEDRCRTHAGQTRIGFLGRSFSPGVHRAEWALGLLDLGYGRPAAALRRLEALGLGTGRHQLPGERSAPDLIEAAVRCAEPDRATAPFARFEAVARRIDRPATDALLHRCRALLTTGERAGEHYATALRSHERDSRPFEHARTELLYGEWLRRARSKAEAREHLRAALTVFDRTGARPWSDRARAELAATGLTLKDGETRPPEAASLLTPQELQIARLAAQGLTNREIAAQLFLSPRTVGHHLYKAYPKLGVASRGELAALPLDAAGA